jgi:hypothetical protein
VECALIPAETELSIAKSDVYRGISEEAPSTARESMSCRNRPDVDVDQGSDTWARIEMGTITYPIRSSTTVNCTALGRRGSALPVKHDYELIMEGLLHMQQVPCQKPQ